MKVPKTRNRSRAAFSLLELLLVMALVVVLASLLLPALARSKTSAQRIRCLSNLRQLGLAAHLYWDDNNGTCFRYGGKLMNGGQLYWFGWLAAGTEGQRAFDASAGALYPYLRGRGVELCPAFNYSLSQFKLKGTGATYGYGYNLYLSAGPNDPPIKAARIVKTSSTALFADAAQVNTWQAPASIQNPMLEEWYYVDADTNQPNGHFRHSQKANVVFCDGHGESESFVRGSLDQRMPVQCVGTLRRDILMLP